MVKERGRLVPSKHMLFVKGHCDGPRVGSRWQLEDVVRRSNCDGAVRRGVEQHGKA
jgi:hypothetical protein